MKIYTNDLTGDEYSTYLGACRAADALALAHPTRIIRVLDSGKNVRATFLHMGYGISLPTPSKQRAPRRIRNTPIPMTSDVIDVAITARPATVLRNRNRLTFELSSGLRIHTNEQDAGALASALR